MTGGKGQAAVASLAQYGTTADDPVDGVRRLQRRVDGDPRRGRPRQAAATRCRPSWSDHGAQLLWHPSLSLESPREAAAIIDRIDRGRAAADAAVRRGQHHPRPERHAGASTSFEGRPEARHRRRAVRAGGVRAGDGQLRELRRHPGRAAQPVRVDRACSTRTASPAGCSSPEWRSRRGPAGDQPQRLPGRRDDDDRDDERAPRGPRPRLDKVGRPATQKPCLSDPGEKRCRTADKVGYACYGCIGPKFPLSKALFKHRARSGSA